MVLLGACVRPSERPGEDAAPGGGAQSSVRAAAVVVRPDGERRETGLPRVVAEIASTRAARERGLSGRDHLPPDGGMLFVYPDERPRRFWMKDCWIALDIAFLRSDGEIVRLATLPPGAGLRGEEIPAADCATPCRYVLETGAGWFVRNGLRVGDRVDVASAVEGVAAE